jgi:hypothetical protein
MSYMDRIRVNWGNHVKDKEMNEAELDEVFEKLKRMLQTMRFGSVTLVVQDGKVIQLEKNEKVRIK